MFIAFLSLASLFFYTIVQLNYHIPGKYLSASNLSLSVVSFIVFFFICIYLYNTWKNKPRRFIAIDYLLVTILFGGSSISGVFPLASELHSEHWVARVGFVIFFCILLPFLLLVFLNLKTHNRLLRKVFLVGVFLSLLILIELKVFCPIRDNFVLKQAFVGNTNKSISLTDSPNILLIVMDTARAANISLYGYNRATTPNLDKFAKRSTIFKNAISSSPWTKASHASLFTGLISYIHGATYSTTEDTYALPLYESFDTLAELLTLRGYVTGAVVANTAYLAPWTG